jgi:hypothetical protein
MSAIKVGGNTPSAVKPRGHTAISRLLRLGCTSASWQYNVVKRQVKVALC